MAIVVIGRNGIGLGHQARLASLCEALRYARQTPVLLCQGSAHEDFLLGHTTWSCPYLSQLTTEDQEVWRRNLESYVRLSEPSLVIEDTHPSGIRFSGDVRRILIIRPLSFEPMMNLLRDQENAFDSFVIADDPDSPTWPYSEVQTKTLLSVRGLSIAGPLFRSPHPNDLREVRRRYGISPQNRVCLFSLGGGGDHAGANDAETFLVEAVKIGRRLRRVDPRSRLMFVKGPLFPKSLRLPSDFEVLQVEPQMPALFQLAHTAVVRLGFNSVWEAISGKTPIVPFVGTSYQEPMERRLDQLLRKRIAFTEIEEAWELNKFKANSNLPIHQIVKRWSGRPRENTLKVILSPTSSEASSPSLKYEGISVDYSEAKTDTPDRRLTDEPIRTDESAIREEQALFPLLGETGSKSTTRELHQWSLHQDRHDYLTACFYNQNHSVKGESPFRKLNRPAHLVLRVDDVIDLHDGLRSLIDFSSRNALPVSLETIPFHCTLTEEQLRSVCDVTLDLVEISQHGYAHVPFDSFLGDNAEFNPYTERPRSRELNFLREGRLILRQRFGNLFKGGYSAPFDRLPRWLSEAWLQMGGEFLSYIWERPHDAMIRSVKIHVEPWDWKRTAARSTTEIISEVCRSTSRNGYVGFVIHQQHLHDTQYLHDVKQILSVLLSAGFLPRSLSDHAEFQASMSSVSPNRDYQRKARYA